MRNVRKLLLLAVAAIVAMAFAPSVASAQTVELEKETGGHCPDSVEVVNHVPDDLDCSIHATTEPGTTADLFQHTGTSEVPFSQCENEFEAAFDEDGFGYIYDQVLTPEGGTCGREPCDESETSATPHRNFEWPAQIREVAAGEELIEVTFCLTAHNPTTGEGTAGTPCTVHLHVNRVGHEYEVESGDGVDNHESPCENLGGIIELEGHWVTSPAGGGHDGFEVHHL